MLWHIARPSVAQVPMLIIDEFKIRQRELLLEKLSQLFLNGFCPSSYENNKFINVPCYSSSWYLCVVAFKFCFFMLGLGTKVFFGPYLPVKVWVVNEWDSVLSSFLHSLRSQFFFVNTKERMVLRVIPEDSHARHLLIECSHTFHLSLMFLF